MSTNNAHIRLKRTEKCRNDKSKENWYKCVLIYKSDVRDGN